MKQLLETIMIIECMANVRVKAWYIKLKDGRYLLVYEGKDEI